MSSVMASVARERKRPGKTSRINSGRQSALRATRSACPTVRPKVQVVDEQIREVLCREIAFVHSREFTRKDAEQRILGSASPGLAEAADVTDAGRALDLPAYFADLYRHRLLSAEQELDLFRRMNFLKFRANALRAAWKPHMDGVAVVKEINRYLAAGVEVRDQIITANLRLVVSLARKYSGNRQMFEDLLSEGNIALIRAIEKFDYSRGFRFSTYATHAIQRDFFRQLSQYQKEQARTEYGIEDFTDVTMTDSDDDSRSVEEFQRYQRVEQAMADELDPRDREVLLRRFGLMDGTEPQTLKTIGEELGLSKERVRQLEIRAIEKLKQRMEQPV